MKEIVGMPDWNCGCIMYII